MKIPFVDLHSQYLSIEHEIDRAIQSVFDSSSFVLGPAVESFENDFAAYCGTTFCVGVNNGTNALILALRAFDVGPGDEVVTAANTFVATVSAIIQTGAKPVLVDVDPESKTIDPVLLKMAVSRKTKVIIPVHLYGRMADMDSIMNLAEHYHLAVLEDAAQAHGAKYNGRCAGSIGQAGAFSFYPAKNLGAYGEAGAIVTNDPHLNGALRCLRNHGGESSNCHNMIGYNARMEGLQGAVLGVKLKYLDQWNINRRQVAQWYSDLLKDTPLILPVHDELGRHVFHLYVVETDRRQELVAYLADNDIATHIHYPTPVHLQKGFEYLGYRPGEFPITEEQAGRILSLPIYPELSHTQVEYICETIRDFFDDR